MSGLLHKAYETFECNYTCGLTLQKFLRILSLIGMISSLVYIAVGSYIIVHIVQTEKVEWFPNAYYRLPEGPIASRIVVPPPPPLAHPPYFQYPGGNNNAEDFGIYRPKQQHYQNQHPFQENLNNVPFSQHSIFPMGADEGGKGKDESSLRLEEQDRAIYYRRNVGLFICLAATLILINFIQLIADITLFHSTFKGKRSTTFWVFFLMNIILWIMTLICFITIFSGGGIFLLLVFLTGTGIRVYMVYILHELMSDIRKPRAYSGASLAESEAGKPEPRTIIEAEEGCSKTSMEENNAAAEDGGDDGDEEEGEATPDGAQEEEEEGTAAASTKSLQPSPGSQSEIDGDNEANEDVVPSETEHLQTSAACNDDAPEEGEDGNEADIEVPEEEVDLEELEKQIVVEEEVEQNENENEGEEEIDAETVEATQEEESPDTIPDDDPEEETDAVSTEEVDGDKDGDPGETIDGALAEGDNEGNEDEAAKEDEVEEDVAGDNLAEDECSAEEIPSNSDQPGESIEQPATADDVADIVVEPEDLEPAEENIVEDLETPDSDLADPDNTSTEGEGKADVAVQANPGDNDNPSDETGEVNETITVDPDGGDEEPNKMRTESTESDEENDDNAGSAELDQETNSGSGEDGEKKVLNEQSSQESPEGGEQAVEGESTKTPKNSRKRRKNSRRKRKVKLIEEKIEE